METIGMKKFVGVIRSHPSSRDEDQRLEVEIIAKDLNDAEAEINQIIKRKGISIDGYSIKEAKA